MLSFTVLALVSGAALGFAARGYLMLLQRWPELAEPLHTGERYIASHDSEHVWLLVTAVLFAPFAEEYLFRGMLFRALQREWGDKRAIFGSALFFAIYHPPLSWPPVAIAGAAAAWLFARGGHLLPCVVMHMAYNAVVLARL